ncbi:MAG: zinc ABC transporter substrate-binding protein [Phormidesmis sp.]
MSERLRGAVIACVIALTSCTASQNTVSQTSEGAPAEGTLQVVTTFLPMTNFTLAVAGDRAQVSQLLPANVTPHDYQSKPQDVQRLAEADVLVENGLELETFLEDLTDNADNADLTVIDASKGIETLALAVEREDVEHEHGEADPHVWLDPKKAIQQVENIRDGLIAADPEGEGAYTENAAAYITQLQTLDQRMSQVLAPYAGKTFVTYHDFAHYFAQSYDLEVAHLVSVPEDNAAPADVKRVIEAAQSSNLKTLLSEPQQQGNPFAALADDLGVQVSIFDPLETSGPEGRSPNYYLTTMEQNLDSLQAAFAQASP